MSVDHPSFALVADTAGACPPTETVLALSVGGPLTTAFLNVCQAPTGLPAEPGRRLPHLTTSGFNFAYNLCLMV